MKGSVYDKGETSNASSIPTGARSLGDAILQLCRKLSSCLNGKAFWTIRIILTILGLLWVAWYLDWDRLLTVLSDVRVEYLIIGTLLHWIFVLLRIIKWRLITTHNGLKCRYLDQARLFLVSLLVGMFTPARVGEIACVACFEPKQKALGGAIFLFGRVVELVLVLILALPGALYIPSRKVLYGLLMMLACLLLLLGFIGSTYWGRWRVKLVEASRINYFRILRERGFWVPLSYYPLTVCAYLSAIAGIYIILLGTPGEVHWSCLLLIPIVFLTNIISITVGGLGIREGAAILLLPLSGISPETAAGVFFLAFVLSRIVPGILGLVWNLGVRRNGHEA